MEPGLPDRLVGDPFTGPLQYFARIVRVVRSFAYEVDDWRKGLIWMMEQNILLFQHRSERVLLVPC